MHRDSADYSWRLVAVIAVLFILALFGLPLWQQKQLERQVEMPLGASAQPSAESPAAGIVATQPSDAGPVKRIYGPELPPRRAITLAANPEPARSPAPVIAPVGPLVADNIDLDPSITETPALPANNPATEAPSLADETNPEGGDPLSLELDTPTRISEPPPSSIQEEARPKPDLPATAAWPYPGALIEQLDALAAAEPEAVRWVGRVKHQLGRLTGVDSLASPEVLPTLQELDNLAIEGKNISRKLPTEARRSTMLRAGYAIVRRLPIWDVSHKAAVSGPMGGPAAIDREAWHAALASTETYLAQSGVAAPWRKYLRLEDARSDFDSAACSPADQRDLARDILHRLHSTQLSHVQEHFLADASIQTLEKHLRQRAVEPLDLVAILGAIERYEYEDLSAQAMALAAAYDQLRWTGDERADKLAENINAFYRNANIRVALSAELINRMLPRQQQQYEPVQDTIQGAWVEGDSHTNTDIRCVLLPDPQRWNVGLEALGSVQSETWSSKGPATFQQNGLSYFRARKRVLVDRRGIRMFNAEANADANTHLNDFETDFDGIPLLGYFARSIAKNQYQEAQPAAKVEVEGKIIVRATNQLDREVAAKLEKSRKDFQTKMIEPLQKLDLEPTAVQMETTTDRLIGRYRVAGRDQIGAHTPRPQAPGDSLLSVQVHESALNNVLQHLDLQGKRIELRQLYTDMTGRFNREPIPVPDDLPEDVHVTFADEDPVRIDCQDGSVRLTIRLKELSHGNKQKWENFTVRGYYVPDAEQLDANLVREGVIELIGDRLRFGDQIALRGIFSRVLSRNRKLNLVNKQIAQAPELRDQQVTQFVIHDGWIGVALGPKAPGRTAWMQPRPELGTDTK